MEKTTTRKTFEIELTRHNVTPAQFLAYVRNRVDAKGGRYLRGDLDLDYFKAGNDMNFDFIHEDDSEGSEWLKGVHERSVSKPYEMQTYIRYPNGAVYNEICEFTFWDDKTGTGYYYLVNVEAVEEESEEMTTVQKIEKITEAVKAEKTRSAWAKGVQAYALEMLEEMHFSAEHGYIDEGEFSNSRMLEKALLNGAQNWKEYSWGGCALIYDGDIAERLCNRTELKRTHNGQRKPNSREEWLDTQARALSQACAGILWEAAPYYG